MSTERIARWMCDQCDETVETPIGTQPDGWIGLAFFSTPEHAETQGRRLHICLKCAEGKGAEHAVMWLHRLVVS